VRVSLVGFITVTYILDGSFIHRDSIGVRQQYGNLKNSTALVENDHKHTQWLHTGKGILHEEMFDNTIVADDLWKPKRQELYQLWLNVPARQKWCPPESILLGSEDETPLVVDETSQTLVLAGRWKSYVSSAPTTDSCILHVEISPQGRWDFPNIPAEFETILIYVRRGVGLRCITDTAVTNVVDIPVHHVAYFDKKGDSILLQNTNDRDSVDFLLLAGSPINEPFYSSGSMVMNTPQEVNEAYMDYEHGLFGQAWDYRISDQEWENVVKPPDLQ